MKSILFKEFVQLQRGFDLPSAQRKTGPFPVVASTSIHGSHATYKVEPPGVVTGRSGSLGTVLYLDRPFWPLNTTLWVKDFKGNLPRYVYYYLQSLDLGQYNAGTGVPTLNRNHLDELPVVVHQFKEQKMVAALLAAYEELIENNLGRIEILEEMTQSIYREWFVNFRFPGRQDGSIKKERTLPEGWGYVPYVEQAEFCNGFAFKPSMHWQKTGLPIVKIKELKNGVTSETPRYHGSDVPKKHHINSGSLLFSWSADLDAYLWGQGDALLNQHIFEVVPKRGLSRLFLLYSLKNQMHEFRARAQGTTMRHIKRSALSEVRGLVPDGEAIQSFDTAADPIHTLVINLESQNRNLQTTRDLLLPKLISGEIDISDLDIDTSWLAA